VGARCENKISDSANFIYLVTTNSAHNRFPLNFTKQRRNDFGKLPTDINKIDGVEYYDLRGISQTCKSLAVQPVNPTMCIKLNRMRPLFGDGSRFNFNGHYHFSESGRSDNPQIGTTEDWFFINTLSNTHPIHVHLINYQVIAQGTLKSFTVSNLGRTLQCSLYEIDFYRHSGLLDKHEKNLTKLCIDSKTIQFNNHTASDILSKVNLEDEVNADDSSVSGLDVLKTFSLSSKDESDYYNSPLLRCPSATNNLKYLCGPMDTDLVPEHEKRWKEVTHLSGFIVRQVRIRWAMTDYNPEKAAYPYFKVPEDELLEYPGYVYHCHFLRHEDNELMRPFMMQPSDQFAANYQPTGKLKECMKRRGLRNEDGWKARVPCINELSGCNIDK
jgi:hypothetical protein